MKGRLAAAAVLALAIPTVAFFEGDRLAAYLDPVGIPTICYGYAGGDVRPSDRATREQCDALLTVEVWEHYQGAMGCLSRPLTNEQAAAVTSFTYNVGVGAFCGSTMARKINAGAPATDWCRELDRWVYAGGRKLGGLVRRRAHERDLCLGVGQ